MELSRDQDAGPASGSGVTSGDGAEGTTALRKGLASIEPVPLHLLYPSHEQQETFTDAEELAKLLPKLELHEGSADHEPSAPALPPRDDDGDYRQVWEPSAPPLIVTTERSSAQNSRFYDDEGVLEIDLETQHIDQPTEVQPSAPPLPPRSPLAEDTDDGLGTSLNRSVQDGSVKIDTGTVERTEIPEQQDRTLSKQQIGFDNAEDAVAVHSNKMSAKEATTALAQLAHTLRPTSEQRLSNHQARAPLYPTMVPLPMPAPDILLDDETLPSAPSAPTLHHASPDFTTVTAAPVELINVTADNRYLTQVLPPHTVLKILSNAESAPLANLHYNTVAALDLNAPEGLEPVEDEFTQLLRKFRAAEESYEDFVGQLTRRIEDCRLKRGQVWARKNGRAEQTQETRSGTGTVKASVSFQHAAFSRKKARAFEIDMARIGDLRSKDLTTFGFDRTMTAYNVEQKIYEELALSPRFCPRLDASRELSGVSGTDSSNRAKNTSPSIRHARAENLARIYFTVLISFELRTRRELEHERVQALPSQSRWRNRFLRCIRAWLAHLGAALVQSGRLEDRFFLLKHLIAFPGVGSPEGAWAVPLLQAGPSSYRMGNGTLIHMQTSSAAQLADLEWADDDVQVCLAMVQSLLDHAEPLFGTADGYEVVDDAGPLDRRLSEADYIALLEQCPYELALEHLLPNSDMAPTLMPEQIKAIFARIHAHVLSLGAAATRLKWFAQLGRMLAHAVVRLVVRAGDFLRDLECWGVTEAWAVAQMHFDRLTLLAATYVMTSSNKNLRLAIKDLPLERLSCEAAWRLFLGLILGYHEPDLCNMDAIYTVPGGKDGEAAVKTAQRHSSASSKLKSATPHLTAPAKLFKRYEYICSYEQWKVVVDSDPAVRKRFYEVLQTSDADVDTLLASPPTAHASGSKKVDEATARMETQISATPRHGEALYRAVALSSLGSACSKDLAQAVILEISTAAFNQADCELAHDELLHPICDMLASVCKSHPELTSEVLHFVSMHDKELTKQTTKRGLKLFQALPLRQWSPRLPDDIDIIRGWLMPRTSSEEETAPVLDAYTEMAMAILSELDYSADANGELYLDARIHRSIALIIAEACMARTVLPHLERVTHTGALATLRRWIPMTTDYTNSQDMARFEHWCWLTLLCLSMYKSSSGEPLIPLLDASNPADAGPGGTLYHLWNTALHRARSMAEDSSKTLDSSSSSSKTTTPSPSAQEAVHKFLHPILSFVILETSNHVQKVGWVPLKSLLHFSSPGVSTNWQLVERAYLCALQNLMPQYAFELFDEQATFTYQLLPGPGQWLFPFLESVEARDRAMESGPGIVAMGSGLVGDLISRVMTPDLPAAGHGPKSQQDGTQSPSSIVSHAQSTSSNNSAFETLITRVGQSAAGRLRSLVEAHVCSSLLCEEPNQIPVRERIARACVNFWMDQILSIPQWRTRASCRTVLDGIVMASMCVQSELRSVDLISEVDGRLLNVVDSLVNATNALDEQQQQHIDPTALSIVPAPPASGFFARTDVSEIVSHVDWLSFEALLVETAREYPLWQRTGEFLSRATNCDVDLDRLRTAMETELVSKEGDGAFKNAHHALHVDLKKLSQFRIYRWANYALKLSPDHPLLFLYWQITLKLIFSKGSNERIFGIRFLTRAGKQTRRANVREALLTRARELQLHFKDLARRQHPSVAMKTTSISSSSSAGGLGSSPFRKASRRRFSVARRRSSSMSSVGDHSVTGDSCLNSHNPGIEQLNYMSSIFGAFALWLRDPDPHSWLGQPGKSVQVSRLGAEFCVSHLQSILESPLLQRLHESLRTATAAVSSSSLSQIRESPSSHLGVSARSLMWFDIIDLAPFREDMLVSIGSWSPSRAARRHASSINSASHHGSAGRAGANMLHNSNATSSTAAGSTLFGGGSASETLGNYRPAPIYLFREPVLPQHLDYRKADLASFLQELQLYARQYAEQTAHARELAKEVQDLLPHLYVQQSRVETVYQQGPSTKDKEPYRFDIPFEESIVDQDVDHRLGEAWESWLALSFGWTPAPLVTRGRHGRERMLSTSSADSLSSATALAGASEREQHICGLVATIFALVKMLCNHANLVEDATLSVEAHRRGLIWFRDLLDVETPGTRSFPPAQRLLWTAISKMGHAFARDHEDDTLLILSKMLDDTHRIHLLSPLFRPSNRVEYLLDFYTMAWTAAPRIPARDMILVLEHFEFSDWLALKPSRKLRVKLLCMVGSVLRQKSWKSQDLQGDGLPAYVSPEDVAAEARIFEFHLDLLLEICAADPEDHFIDVVQLLIGAKSLEIDDIDELQHFANDDDRDERKQSSLSSSMTGSSGTIKNGKQISRAGAENLRIYVPSSGGEQMNLPLSNKVWDAVLVQLGSGIWNSNLSLETLYTACEVIGSHFFQLRMHGSGNALTVCTNPGSLVQQWTQLELVEHISRLTHKLVLLMCAHLQNSAYDESIWPKEVLVRTWGSLATLFRPWLLSEYLQKHPEQALSPMNPGFTTRYLDSEPVEVPTLGRQTRKTQHRVGISSGSSSNSGSSASRSSVEHNQEEAGPSDRRYEAPWSVALEPQAGIILKSFVACVRDLVSAAQQIEPFWVLDQVWWLYIDDLAPSAQKYVSKTIAGALLKLPWETWSLCDSILAEFVRLVETYEATDATFHMVRYLLEHLNWTLTETHQRRSSATLTGEAHLGEMILRHDADSQASNSDFYAQVLRLLLTILMKEKMPVPKDFTQFFFEIAHSLPWTYVSPIHYRDTVLHFEVMLNDMPKSTKAREATEAKSQGIGLDSVEKKSVAAIRLLGAATMLGAFDMRRLNTNGEVDFFNALQRERCLLGLLENQLQLTCQSGPGRTNTNGESSDVGVGEGLSSSSSSSDSSDTGACLRKLGSESAKLPFSSGALVMLFFESMQRLHRLVNDRNAPWAQVGSHVKGVREIAAGAASERVLAEMQATLVGLLSLLNVPGVVCVRLDASRSQLQGGDVGVANAVFGKVENVLRSISENLPPALQFHEGGETLEHLNNLQTSRNGTGQSIAGPPSAQASSRAISNEEPSSSSRVAVPSTDGPTRGLAYLQWAHWKIMWRSVLPCMIAAARLERPFDRIASVVPLEPTTGSPEGSFKAAGLVMRRLTRRGVSSTGNQPANWGQVTGFTNKDCASLDITSLQKEGHFSVTGVGVGTLLHTMIRHNPPCAPLYISAALKAVTSSARFVELMEAALDSWFTESNDLAPVLASLGTRKGYQRVLCSEDIILRYEACAIRRGAWLSWYAFEMYALSSGLSSGAEVMARLAHAMTQAVHTETTSPGSFLHPSPVKILPLMWLLLDLVVRDFPDDAVVNDAAFKVQQLHVSMAALQSLVLDKGNMISALASAVFRSLPSLPFGGYGSSSPQTIIGGAETTSVAATAGTTTMSSNSQGLVGTSEEGGRSSSVGSGGESRAGRDTATEHAHDSAANFSGSSPSSAQFSPVRLNPQSYQSCDSLVKEEELRIFVRSLQALIYLNSHRRSGTLRLRERDGVLNAESRKAQQALQALTQTFADSSVARWSSRFCSDSTHTLASYPTLLEELISSLFPHVTYLQRGVHEWETRLHEAVKEIDSDIALTGGTVSL